MNKLRDRRGNSVIEFALMTPWILFAFVGALDWGFFSYALISTQSAARVAATYASTDSTTATDSAGVCMYALYELEAQPNVGASVTTCNALPVVVTTQLLNAGPDGAKAAQVDVAYQTVPLIPIPGLLTGQITLKRTVKMKLKG